MSAQQKAQPKARKVKHRHHCKERVNGVWACAEEGCDVKLDRHGKIIEPPVRGHLKLVV